MSAALFNPGERIALPYLPILKIENNVAILKKSRFAIGSECGARHRVKIEMPFYVRGGFKVFSKTMHKVPGWAFEVAFKTPYGTFAKELVPQGNMYVDEISEPRQFAEKLAREMFGNKVAEVISVEVKEKPKTVNVYVRRFSHVEVLMPPDDYFIHYRNRTFNGDTYFVYEFIAADEAKLVDDTSRIDYVVLTFGNGAESRSGCAQIKILSGDGVVWQETKSACCAIRSGAVAAVIARHGSRVVIAKNNLPYRGCCENWTVEEWLAEFPPRRVSSYDTTEPMATSELRPEEVA